VTDGFGDETVVPGQRISFLAWPFFLRKHDGIGGTNELRETSVLPLFSITRSPARDITSVVWPFFRRTDDREKDYREWGFPWPLWGVARGPGKHMNRAWPFFSVAANETLRSEWYFWPVWKRNTADTESLYRRNTRVGFFLYQDLVERDRKTGEEMHRMDLWPFVHRRRQLDGREHLQVLAVLEPLLPNNKSVERNWSPLWSLWRTEKNPGTGRRSDSLLWNLWRRETSAEGRQDSFFFGLLSRRKTADGSRWSWFDSVRGKASAAAPAAPQPQIGFVPLRPIPFGPFPDGR